jgi:hypothetical protein
VIDTNSRFNEELQQQIEGTLPKGHVYQLGMPSEILLGAGLPDLPIELNANRLAFKASKNYRRKHPFDLSDIKDLPKAINEPIAIFNSTKANDKSKIILTELKDKNGYNFVAILNIFENPKKDKINMEVNSIRSVYPKDRMAELINWFKSGDKLVAWQDKEKASHFISNQPPYRIAEGNKAEAFTSKYNKNFWKKQGLGKFFLHFLRFFWKKAKFFIFLEIFPENFRLM